MRPCVQNISTHLFGCITRRRIELDGRLCCRQHTMCVCVFRGTVTVAVTVTPVVRFVLPRGPTASSLSLSLLFLFCFCLSVLVRCAR